MYERFSIYVSAETLYKLRDLFAREREGWLQNQEANRELIGLWGELEARVQHLPQGIEKPTQEDWLNT